MPDAIVQLARRHGFLRCTECGKCVAACPMWEVFDDFSVEASPRRVIAQTLRGLTIAEQFGVWFCLTCDLCTLLCPAGVRFTDFVKATRQLLIEAGAKNQGVFCRKCGLYLWPRRTVDCLARKLGETSSELLSLCPRCRRYDFGAKLKAFTPRKKVHTQETQMVQGQPRGS